ncbi:fimbrial biogenesis outer membrane usher protein [Pseudomonas plecoglossicida]|uniref:Fimbrial biogenesis outer membrane usher protein n=2 Tax=Pseudomonas plecoglossicida TaxID=70775 RepID=A0AAD0QTJ0_PSEDL|nr:fimbrial biogenesis outer membrane usher protein [Pseudomonas plecoglossicida]
MCFTMIVRSRHMAAGVLSGYLAGPAAAIEFDPGLLREGTSVDLRRFEQGATVPEGIYTLDVTLNQQWMGRHRMPLRVQEQHQVPTPCYSEPLLRQLGVDTQRLSREVRERLQQEEACIALVASVSAASEALDLGNLQLDLQIPQQALLRLPSGYLPAENWDSGVTAAFFDYRLNLYEQHDLEQDQATRQTYLGVRAGFNSGQWYWRHEGSWQASTGLPSRYQPVATSVRRDIPAWSAQLTLGDGYSSSEVFEGSAMRGVLLGSDQRMLAQEQRGYAPVVRGVANSTALLSIRQRGMLLHESTVAPGPFEIDDLYASGLNDDLEVTLRESDGSVRTFFLPYQTAPLALRPGARRFELGSGVWREAQGRSGPGFVQGSWQQGLDNRFSVHGGTWIAEDYLGSAMGVAINTGFGALGLTGYHAHATLARNQQVRGQAWRLSWRQRLSTSATDLSASLTRSEGPGYYSFNDYARVRGGARIDSLAWQAGLGLDQQLGERGGRFNLRASLRQSRAGRSSDSYSVGYNNYLGSLSYGINLNRELRAARAPINTLTVNASMPFGERRRSSLATAFNRDSHGQGSSSVRWSGTAGEHRQWGHGLALVHQEGERASSGFDANLLHRGAKGEFSGSLSSRRGYRQATLGAQGALVAHQGGVVAAPPLGESFAIVHAPGADAAHIRQHPHVKLDRRGYAVVPSLSPYSVNTVELDPKGMSRDTELLLAAQSVVPHAGAVSLLHYPTRSGRQFTLQGRFDDGSALPFGAQVLDAQDNELGMVGQGSRLHVRSDADAGTLEVKWGDADDERCSIVYQLSAEQASHVCTRQRS